MREFFRKNSTIINLGFFMRFCYLVLISFFLNSPAYAENLLNPNECALQMCITSEFCGGAKGIKKLSFYQKKCGYL